MGDNKKLIIDAVRTNSGCPAQWKVRTNKGEAMLVSYRWGILTVDDARGVTIFEKKCGGQYDGMMDYNEVRRHTTHLFVWPSFEKLGNAL